jgi:hypothetical protein
MLALLLAAAADPTGGLLDFLQKGGVLGLLVLIVLSGARGWWVFSWQYRDLKQDRDDWKQLALSATRTGEKVADAVEKTARKPR